MPTIVGMRRRGYTPGGIRLFAQRIGISKSENVADLSRWLGAVREDLENSAPRVMAVLDPVKVTLTNYDPAVCGSRTAPFHPHHPEFGERDVPLSREIYIERDDFAEVPPPKWCAPDAGRRSAPALQLRDQVQRNRQGYAAVDTAALWSSSAPSTLIRWARTRKAARSRASSTGSVPNMPSRPRSACMTGCSRLSARMPGATLRPANTSISRSSIRPPATITGHVEACGGCLAGNPLPAPERVGYFVTDRVTTVPASAWCSTARVVLKDGFTAK